MAAAARDRARERRSSRPSCGRASTELARLAGADPRGRPEGAPAARAQPPRRRPAAADRALARARPAEDELGARPREARRGSTRRGGRSRSRSRSCATVARGLHPAVVSGHGLEVALEQLAALAPVPVRPDGRRSTVACRSRLEVATYYLVSESLANVGKHAHALVGSRRGRAQRRPARRRGASTTASAAPTRQRGGACAASPTGSRRSAGSLRVWSPAGGGTRVRAEMPCGS